MLLVAPPQAQIAIAERERTAEGCYLAYRDEVFRTCLRLSAGRRAMAEDLTQDVFAKLLDQDLESIDDVGAWLYRAACNLAISRLRREKSFRDKLRRWLGMGEAQTSESPERAAVAHERAARALAALRALPPKESVVLTMSLLDLKSQREIARDLSLSEGYVSKLLARARERVERSALEEGEP